MTLNLKKKVTLTASQMLAENNRATADRLTWAAQTDEANLRTALNVPENGLTEEMAVVLVNHIQLTGIEFKPFFGRNDAQSGHQLFDSFQQAPNL